MILRCNYEELSALKTGAQAFLDRDSGELRPGEVAPEVRVHVAALFPDLVGDLTVETLAELYSLETAVDAIVATLRSEMEVAVVATHAADEQAVAAYFDFAHAFSVQARVLEVAGEMQAIMELVEGGPPTAEIASDFVFPD